MIAIRLSSLEFCFVSFCGFSYAPIVKKNVHSLSSRKKKLIFPHGFYVIDAKKTTQIFICTCFQPKNVCKPYIQPNIGAFFLCSLVAPTKRVILYTCDIRLKLLPAERTEATPQKKKLNDDQQQHMVYIENRICVSCAQPIVCGSSSVRKNSNDI